MIRVPVDIRGMEVWHDLRAKRWTIQYQCNTYTLLDWNWEQRYALVRDSVIETHFMREQFIDHVFSELLESIPDTNRIVLAYTILNLLGVPKQQPLFSLAHAEFLLAQAFGWRPSDLSEQPVTSLDAMVQKLAEQEQQYNAINKRVVSDGWRTIIFNDTNPTTSVKNSADPPINNKDEEGLLRVRLQEMLDAVAVWAGVMPDSALEETSQRANKEIAADDKSIVEQTSKTLNNKNNKKDSATLKTENDSAVLTTPEITQNASEHQPLNFFKGTARLKKTTVTSHVPSAAEGSQSHDFVGEKPLLEIDKNSLLKKQDESVARQLKGVLHSNVDVSPLTKTSTQLPHLHKYSESMRRTTSQRVIQSSRKPNNKMLTEDYPSNLKMKNAIQSNLIHKNSSHTLTAIMPRDEASMEMPMPFSNLYPLKFAGQVLTVPSCKTTPEAQADHPAANLSREAANDAVRLESSFESLHTHSASGLSNPFALSSFEEQMADALERAVREAGIDLP